MADTVKQSGILDQVECAGLGGFHVDRGMSTLHNLVLSLPWKQDEVTVGFFLFFFVLF